MTPPTIYLRRTGKRIPLELSRTLNRTGLNRGTLWTVRDRGEIVGYVVARQQGRAKPRFRGILATGETVTPEAPSRRRVRNRTSTRRNWTAAPIG